MYEFGGLEWTTGMEYWSTGLEYWSVEKTGKVRKNASGVSGSLQGLFVPRFRKAKESQGLENARGTDWDGISCARRIGSAIRTKHKMT